MHKFNDNKYPRSTLAEVVLPGYLHAPFGRRLCVRPKRSFDGSNGQVWTHRVHRTLTLCDACAWTRPPANFAEFAKVPVHWLAEEVRAVALTKCTQCRRPHLQWRTPANCTGCIRAILEVKPQYLPAFPVLEAPRPLEPPKPRDIPWVIPAGAE